LSEEFSQQLEAVCGSVFGELESQAVDALDLPGCFRMRSHSYLRAIQAGCSQDDDCLPLLAAPASVSGRPGSSFNFRKAPPPIPTGSQAPPRISITAQSSTDSAHESFTAAEGPARRCSSADGLDGPAMGARTLELAPVPPRASPKPPTLIIKTIPGREELRSLARQRKWRPSIGVQVETISDSDTENRSRREFHSIGVQVEEDKRRARFKRSNSVTAGVQADLELEGLAGLATVATEDKALQFGRSFQRHASEPQPGPRAPTYSVFRTVHTQGQWAYREGYPLPYEPPATDGSPGPTPIPAPGPGSGRRDSWMERGSRSLPDSGRTSPCPRDGEWFIRMLRAEVEKLEHWCQQMEREAEDFELPEEILEKIRSAVGSTQLLLSQKVQQFFRLCQQSLDPTAFPVPTFQDLAGFWDLLQLSIEDVTLKFLELQQLKANSWKLLEPKEEKKVPPPIPKKPSRGRGVPVKERSLDSVDRQRQEARKRLLAAKRAASFRHSSATESADSIEIYIPEAQTRLKNKTAELHRSQLSPEETTSVGGLDKMWDVMWPVLWTVVRTYAPYVTFPVAFVVGAVGYHLEWFIRGKDPQPVEEEKSILERREDRKLDELLGKDHTQVASGAVLESVCNTHQVLVLIHGTEKKSNSSNNQTHLDKPSGHNVCCVSPEPHFHPSWSLKNSMRRVNGHRLVLLKLTEELRPGREMGSPKIMRESWQSRP
ncbi:hypothetical protein STEG23_010049, partial [Scotinomys teguina]